MRYFDIDTVSFTNKDGKSAPIKEKRPIENNPIAFEVNTNNQLLDEIASRKDVYGEGYEDHSYKIFDANCVEIIEAGYDLTKVRRMKIPL